ncbi:hypothetical protein HK096_003364 [Nowakowskiella sp. JEL0078]|nr:hypothetical protein HK096_003364 [Nowakowskiella sp. JEL0078]
MNAWEIPRSQVTYADEDLLAEGGTSAVYVGVSEYSFLLCFLSNCDQQWLSTPVAVKVLHGHLSQDLIDSIKQEVAIAYPLRHPHIIQVYGACLDSQPLLVLEYAPLGNLFEVKLTLKKNRLNPASAHQYILEIALGMQYLHTRAPPVLHGDLKSVNVLLADGGKVKLTDFGFAKIKSVSSTINTARGVSGTLRWLAPERLQQSKMSESTDVYSFGMVMYEILSEGKLPFELDGLEDDHQILAALYNQQRPSRPTTILCNDRLWAIVEDCWKQDPNIRPTFPQIINFLGQQETITMNQPMVIVSPNVIHSSSKDIIVNRTLSKTLPTSNQLLPIDFEVDEMNMHLPVNPQQQQLMTNYFVPFPSSNQFIPKDIDINETNMFLHVDHQQQNFITNSFLQFPAVSAVDSHDVVEAEKFQKSSHVTSTKLQTLRKYRIVVTAVLATKLNDQGSGSNGSTTTTTSSPGPTPSVGSLVRTYTGHTDYVSTVAVLPGTPPRLFSGSGDNTIKEWDTITGALARNYTGHTSIVSSIDINSETPPLLFSGSNDKTIKEWDISTNAFVRTYTEITSSVTNFVTSIAVLPGTPPRVFSGSLDNLVKEWDTTTGALVRYYTGHTNVVYSVAVLPGTPPRLFSGSNDNTVKEWNTTTGALVRSYIGHTSLVHAVAVLSGTPPRLFSSSADNTIKEWNTSTGGLVRTLIGHMSTVSTIAVLPGTPPRLFSGSKDNTVKEWSI